MKPRRRTRIHVLLGFNRFDSRRRQRSFTFAARASTHIQNESKAFCRRSGCYFYKQPRESSLSRSPSTSSGTYFKFSRKMQEDFVMLMHTISYLSERMNVKYPLRTCSSAGFFKWSIVLRNQTHFAINLLAWVATKAKLWKIFARNALACCWLRLVRITWRLRPFRVNIACCHVCTL